MAQNSGAPRSQKNYITQVSEEIEGRVTKRLSKEFSRTENRILGALARLDDFLMNPLLPGHRNTTRNNQGTNEDGSQKDPHAEAGLFDGQTTRKVSLEERHDMVTGVQRERVYDHDMVTGATEQIGNCHDITRIHEEVTYRSPSTSSGKQKKNRSTNQPQFRSENTPATIETDQIFLPFNSWQTTTILRISTIILTGSPNCQNH